MSTLEQITAQDEEKMKEDEIYSLRGSRSYAQLLILVL